MAVFDVVLSGAVMLAAGWLLGRRSRAAGAAAATAETADARADAGRAQGLLDDEVLRRRLLFEHSADGVVVLDSQGAVVEANAAFAEMIGHSLQDTLKLHVWDWDVQWPRDEALRQLGGGLAGDRVFERVHRRADGSLRRVDLRAHVAMFAGRQLTFCVCRDITERHHSEQQLRKLSLAVEQSPIGIVITDTAGHFEYVNEAWLQASGYSRDAVLGRRRGDFQQVVRPPGYQPSLFETLARGETWSGEIAAYRKNGELYRESVRARPIRQSDGRITHGLVLAEDITVQQGIAAELDAHRHHLQELVDARTLELSHVNAELVLSRDRAEAASRAKSAFLANTSHEIRTPMNAILGLTHLMQRETAEPVLRGRLDKVADAARRLMRVIDDILDLSKIESGQLQLADIAFSLKAVIEHSLALVAERAQAKRITLHSVARDLPDALRGDPARLTQALHNLLDNAVKFTEQGRIRLQVDLQPGAPAGRIGLRFTVQDSGIGIADRQLQDLFSAFVQVDDSTTRRHGGTGLGLAITQRLAGLMGGEVGASSQPGQGSAFWFSAAFRPAVLMPAPLALPLPGMAQARLREHCAGARVLLAEDNPINQEVARELLEAAGLHVEVASDGRQAVQMVQQQHWDLVLMDMRMPVMDGLQATRAIRSGSVRTRLPILAMTASAFGEDRNACLAAGMNGHVAKPVDADVLYAEVLKWLPVSSAATMTQPTSASVAAAAEAPLPLHAGDLDRLQQLLAAADFHAVGHYRRLAAALRQRCDAQLLAALDAGLRDFDFPRALAALRALREASPALA